MPLPLDLCLTSFGEAVYLGYMFFFFETRIDFNVLASPDHFLLKHLTGNQPGLRICLLGRVLAVPAIVLLIARCRYPHLGTWIRRGVYASIPLSLINLNAVAYLLPIWVTELTFFRGQNNIST